MIFPPLKKKKTNASIPIIQAALVGQVDAELFEAVGLQTFKAVDVQGPWPNG